MEDVRKNLGDLRNGYFKIVLRLNDIANKIVQDEKMALKHCDFLELVVRANQIVKDVY